MSRRLPTTLLTALHRLTAGAVAVVIGVLGLLAVSPEAHAWLHGHDSGDTCGHSHHAHDSTVPAPLGEDEGCVVWLFAQGIDSGVAAMVLDVRPAASVAESPAAPEELRLSPPRYLRRPERGPPAGTAGLR